MFLEQVQNSKNSILRYFAGSCIIFFAAILGAFPYYFRAEIATFLSDILLLKQGVGFDSENKQFIFFITLLPFVFIFLALRFILPLLHQMPFRFFVTARKRLDWGRVFFAFSFYAVFLATLICIEILCFPDDYSWNFKPVPFLVLFIITLLVLPIQTSCEELLFRGYAMQGLGFVVRYKWFPFIFSSVVFGLLHCANPEVDKLGYFALLYYIGSGLFFGLITLMDDGMELALGFHAANNMVGVLLVTSNDSVLNVDSILRSSGGPKIIDMLVPVLIVYPLLLFIFSKKYKWTGWKHKLTGKIGSYESTLPSEDHGEPIL